MGKRAAKRKRLGELHNEVTRVRLDLEESTNLGSTLDATLSILTRLIIVLGALDDE